VKGFANRAAIVSAPTVVDVTLRGRKLTRGARLWPVGVGLVKSELYGWLRLQRPEDKARGLPPGWCHFPMHPEEYFKQLTAEELVTKIVRGYRHTEWEKLANRRNEVLDCRVYARAAAALLGLDRWDEPRWASYAATMGVALTPRPVQDPARTPASIQPPGAAAERGARRPRRGGFLDRWRKD
jgi:phage terminase large subunit GpA-like protein